MTAFAAHDSCAPAPGGCGRLHLVVTVAHVDAAAARAVGGTSRRRPRGCQPTSEASGADVRPAWVGAPDVDQVQVDLVERRDEEEARSTATTVPP